MNKTLLSSIVCVLAMSVGLQGCSTVKKGASGIAQGTSKVVKGTGNFAKSTVKAITPRRKAAPPPQQVTAQVDAKGNVVVGDNIEEIFVSEVTAGLPRQRTKDKSRFDFYPFNLKERRAGDATTNDFLRDKAWGRVVSRTQMRLVGDDRARIDVKSPIIMGVEEMEYLLLARAAGEAARAGYQRFAIVYINYDGGRNLMDLVLPEIKLGGSDWIGSYEDLIFERQDQRLSGKFRKVGPKQIQAVVQFLPEKERRRRESFTANEVYLNMLNENLYGGKYPYKKEKRK